MKLILCMGAIAALAASTQTLAGALQDHQVTTTEDLIELCSGWLVVRSPRETQGN